LISGKCNAKHCLRLVFRRLRKISKSDYYLLHGYLFYRPHGTTPLPLNGFSWNLILCYFFENLSMQFRFNWNMTPVLGTLHKDLRKFLIIYRRIRLKIMCFRQNLQRKSAHRLHVQ
jgi:hypothetical protein